MSGVKMKMEISLPTLPNFVKVGEQSVSVALLTDGQIKRLGKAWTDALLKKAEERRNAPRCEPVKPERWHEGR